jgi:aminopeptidase N
MLVMDGSPSEGLIVHEATHQYLHGILANNEFREAWLDEGFTSYITNRYLEQKGIIDVWTGSLNAARQRERTGPTQPVALASADFVDYATYGAMSYTKAELIFRMLEWMIGSDRMDQVLRTLYARNALTRVDQADLRAAVNSVTGENLDWFFNQWIHTTATLDYAIAEATSLQLPDGRWSTNVTVTREGPAWMPVDLQVGETTVRLRSRERTQTARVTTGTRPSEVVLDPRSFLLEVDVENNRATVAAGR